MPDPDPPTPITDDWASTDDEADIQLPFSRSAPSINTLTTDATSFHDDDENTDMHNNPTSYLPLLLCPACDPPSVLTSPTTLHCGHTVCSSHIEVQAPPQPPSSATSASTSRLPSRIRGRHANQPVPTPSTTPPPPQLPQPCPIPTCPSNASSSHSPSSPQINIPPTSRVAYFPAPRTTPPQQVPHTVRAPESRVDITISKIIALVRRAQGWTQEEEQVFVNDDDGSSTEDEEADIPSLQFPSSGSRPRALSTSTYRPPKKRRRRTAWQQSGDRLTGGGEGTRLSAQGRFEKDLMTEVTCEICFMLLYQPVTTPCQHTFCSKCLHRSLDHSTSCPLCRSDLPPFAYFQSHPYNQTLLSIILKAFPDTYTHRAQIIEQEEKDARLDTPIFVCQLSFPGMPTLLHFFEPRYRLMLRRCLESANPCFGMIMPPRAVVGGGGGNGNEYGTMLEIRSVQMLADGRSMVETWGTHRFRILERGALDGYMVGRIERIDDCLEELDENALAAEGSELIQSTSSSLDQDRPLLTRLLSPTSSRSSSSQSHSLPLSSPEPPRTNEELMSICRSFLDQLRQGTAPWVVQRLNNTYGPMPTDPSSFSFWVALVLPIDEHEKAKLLPIKSARLRLRLVVHWIEQLNSNWWFSSGCIIS